MQIELLHLMIQLPPYILVRAIISIVFDDGTVWNKAQIEANIIGRLLGTDGDDHLQADAIIP